MPSSVDTTFRYLMLRWRFIDKRTINILKDFQRSKKFNKQICDEDKTVAKTTEQLLPMFSLDNWSKSTVFSFTEILNGFENEENKRLSVFSRNYELMIANIILYLYLPGVPQRIKSATPRSDITWKWEERTRLLLPRYLNAIICLHL